MRKDRRLQNESKKILHEIFALEEIIGSAEELHAITFLYYDSFVEGSTFAKTSQCYKTAISIIEDRARELHETLGAAFDKLLALAREKEETTEGQEVF